MQFVAHGPDVPDVLVQAHEEGRVVFFCGAGIVPTLQVCLASRAWFADQANQRVLTMFSGWIVALILGGWAAFQSMMPPKSAAPTEQHPPAQAIKK